MLGPCCFRVGRGKVRVSKALGSDRHFYRAYGSSGSMKSTEAPPGGDLRGPPNRSPEDRNLELRRERAHHTLNKKNPEQVS